MLLKRSQLGERNCPINFTNCDYFHGDKFDLIFCPLISFSASTKEELFGIIKYFHLPVRLLCIPPVPISTDVTTPNHQRVSSKLPANTLKIQTTPFAVLPLLLLLADWPVSFSLDANPLVVINVNSSSSNCSRLRALSLFPSGVVYKASRWRIHQHMLPFVIPW